MTKITAAIHEVRNVVLSMILTDVVLDTLLLFSLSLFVVTLVVLPWWLAFIPSVVYLLWHGTRMLSLFSFRYVEERVPELNEMLRTAVDHTHEVNMVTQELFEDVMKKLKHVRTSYFMEFGHLSKQIIAITAMCFLVIGFAAFNVRFIDLSGVLDKGALLGTGIEFQSLDPLSKGDDSLLYGEEKSLAELGDEQIQLELAQAGSDADPTKRKDIDPGKFKNMYPDDEIGATVADSYAEQIPRKYQDIVKNYFKNIPT